MEVWKNENVYKLKLVIFIISCFLVSSLYAQVPNLSSYSNYYIYTSSNHLTYIGSFDGLNVFDGRTNKVYKPFTHDMIGRNIQGDFIEDQNGRIWFATYTGLNVHVPSKDIIESYQLDVNGHTQFKNYRTIGVFGDTLVVQADEFTALFDITKRKVVESYETGLSDYFSFSSEIKNERLQIIAGGNKGIVRVDINLNEGGVLKNELYKHSVRSIYKDDYLLYIGAFSGGIYLYDFDTSKLTRLYSTNKTINSINQHDDQLLVNIDQEGTFILEANNHLSPILERSIKSSYTIGYIDGNNSLWEGIVNEEPRISNLDKLKFKNLDIGGSVSSLNVLDGELLVGVRGDSYYSIDIDNLNQNVFTSRIKKDNVSPSKIVESGNIAYTYNSGLRRVDLKRNTISRPLPNTDIGQYLSNICIYQDSPILIKNSKFIYKYNPKSKSLDTLFKSDDIITNGIIYGDKFYLSCDDVIVKSYKFVGDGILESATYANINGEILCVQPSFSEDSLFICTVNGIFIADKYSDTSRRVMDKEGALSTAIYAAYVNHDNMVWCSTNEGIIRYDPMNNKVHRFTKPDGVQHKEFNRYAHAQLKDGTLVFGGLEGLNVFHPDSVRLSQKTAPVIISDYRINDATSSKFGAALMVDTIDLPYGENTLAFSFHAIDYGDPSGTRVNYKLIGWDDKYIESSSSNGEIRYANISAGEYTLSLVGANSDGVWNQEDKTVSITIRPPYWQTWWFRLLALGTIGGLVFLAFRYYYRQQLARKDFELKEQNLIIEKQKALQAERTRIAGEMHDDLGGGLTTIRFLSQKVLRRIDNPEHKTQLSKIVDQSQSLVNNMSEIIWAMNAGFDTVENLIAYSRRYAYEYLEPFDIELKFSSKGNMSGIELSGERRRNLFLIIKEALHNIAKHSKADNCIIAIDHNNTLRISISDNGIGLDKSNGILGNGLKNMQKRIENMDGQIEFPQLKSGFQILVTLDIK